MHGIWHREVMRLRHHQHHRPAQNKQKIRQFANIQTSIKNYTNVTSEAVASSIDASSFVLTFDGNVPPASRARNYTQRQRTSIYHIFFAISIVVRTAAPALFNSSTTCCRTAVNARTFLSINTTH
jgi:hypothetical protein